MTSRLKWLCRRGMKELDILMEGYLFNDYPHATAAQQQAFERLLDYQDPVIIDLLCDRYTDPDQHIQALIDELKVKNASR